MKRFFIELLITFIVVFITRQISDTYVCGGIVGILSVYVYQLINELSKELKESDYYKLKQETKEINKELKRIKRKSKALDEICNIVKKHNLELTRSKINNEEVLLIHGIMEES